MWAYKAGIFQSNVERSTAYALTRATFRHLDIGAVAVHGRAISYLPETPPRTHSSSVHCLPARCALSTAVQLAILVLVQQITNVSSPTRDAYVRSHRDLYLALPLSAIALLAKLPFDYDFDDFPILPHEAVNFASKACCL